MKRKKKKIFATRNSRLLLMASVLWTALCFGIEYAIVSDVYPWKRVICLWLGVPLTAGILILMAIWADDGE